MKDPSEYKTCEATPLLTLIRHPETVANLAHALQGATDSPWTVQGKHQAERLTAHVRKAFSVDGEGTGISSNTRWNFNGDIVRAQGSHVSPLLRPGRRPTHILTSPLGRTRSLAERLREALIAADGGSNRFPVLFEIREGLAERNFGQREGQIYSKGSAQAQSKPIVDPAIVATMRAESSEVFQNRVKTEAQSILRILRDDSTPAPHVVVITHGLWIRSFLALALGRVHLPFTSNTGIFTLGLIDRQTRSAAATDRSFGQSVYGLICQNDVSHLSGLKRQRGGIGSSASDSRQRTLKQLWQAGKRQTEHEEAPGGQIPVEFQAVTEGSPTKRPRLDL